MRGERLLRQMSLLAVLWMFNADGVSKLAEAKTLVSISFFVFVERDIFKRP